MSDKIVLGRFEMSDPRGAFQVEVTIDPACTRNIAARAARNPSGRTGLLRGGLLAKIVQAPPPFPARRIGHYRLDWTVKRGWHFRGIETNYGFECEEGTLGAQQRWFSNPGEWHKGVRTGRHGWWVEYPLLIVPGTARADDVYLLRPGYHPKVTRWLDPNAADPAEFAAFAEEHAEPFPVSDEYRHRELEPWRRKLFEKWARAIDA